MKHAGELSEDQKQQMEQYHARIQDQEQELNSLHQQMAQLSQIVDRQTEEISAAKDVARSYNFEIVNSSFFFIILSDLRLLFQLMPNPFSRVQHDRVNDSSIAI